MTKSHSAASRSSTGAGAGVLGLFLRITSTDEMFNTFLQVLDHERKQVIGVALRVVEDAHAQAFAGEPALDRAGRALNRRGLGHDEEDFLAHGFPLTLKFAADKRR